LPTAAESSTAFSANQRAARGGTRLADYRSTASGQQSSQMINSPVRFYRR